MSPPLGLNHFTFSPGSRRLPASHSFANRLCDQPFRFWHLVNEKLYLSVVFLFYIYLLWTIGSGGKEVAVMQETGFDSWVGKIPWRSEWLPTPVVFPGEFHGQRSLMGYSPWSHKELNTTEQLTHTRMYNTHTHTHTHTRQYEIIMKAAIDREKFKDRVWVTSF